MKLRNCIMCLPLAGILLFGCKKTEETYYHGKVKNNLSQPVHLDFYKTLADYGQSANVASSTVIPPNGEYEIPASFEGGSKYYLDWYTDDYLNTNWGSDVSFNVPNITPEMDPALSIPQAFSYTRRVFLNGNKPSVKWKAIDARSGSSSIWSSLNANEKYREIIVNKDLTGSYTYKDELGAIQKMDFKYVAQGGSGSFSTTIFLLFNGSSSSNYVMSAASINGSIQLDTIMNQSFLPPNNSNFYTYYFARQ